MGLSTTVIIVVVYISDATYLICCGPTAVVVSMCNMTNAHCNKQSRGCPAQEKHLGVIDKASTCLLARRGRHATKRHVNSYHTSCPPPPPTPPAPRCLYRVPC